MTFLWGLDLGPRRAAPVDPPMGGVGRTQGPHRYHGGAGSGRPLAGVSYPREIPLSGKAGRKAESTFFEGKGAELAFFRIQNGGIVEKIAKLNVFREKEPNRPSSPRAERQSEIRIGRERNSRGQRREPRLYPRGGGVSTFSPPNARRAALSRRVPLVARNQYKSGNLGYYLRGLEVINEGFKNPKGNHVFNPVMPLAKTAKSIWQKRLFIERFFKVITLGFFEGFLGFFRL